MSVAALSYRLRSCLEFSRIGFINTLAFRLRYYTGIGPIRVDVAFPMDRIKGNRERPVALYISLGQSF